MLCKGKQSIVIKIITLYILFIISFDPDGMGKPSIKTKKTEELVPVSGRVKDVVICDLSILYRWSFITISRIIIFLTFKNHCALYYIILTIDLTINTLEKIE